MGVSRMTGTPWHLEKVTRSDGDVRRHRSHCAYYYKPEKWCNYHHEKCFNMDICIEKEIFRKLLRNEV